MPRQMPEFSMPPEHQASAAGPQGDDRPGRPSAPKPRRGGLRRALGSPRALVAAAVLGAVVGGAAVAGGHAAASAAGVAAEASARTTAQAYLDAIADGRAGDATAIGPVDERAGLLTDASLATAERIRAPEVGLVDVDGQRGTASVRFEVDGREVRHELELLRDAGEWRVATTLAEPMLVPRFGTVSPSIGGIGTAGVDLPLLYPGVYTTDAFEDEALALDPERLVVDGTSTTAHGSALFPRPNDEVAARALATGLAHARACAVAGECSLEQGAPVEAAGDASIGGLRERSAERRDLELHLPVTTHGAARDVQLRFSTDAADARWQCRMASIAGAVEAWEPCRA
ncbi:hypothetical protein [Agrococcus terreus]|uniref:DUF4878 domain-containing protein n=1 Tax=Agrococcus terreus TaxID=574649 RepID=A0ABQ2KMC2_9MICO|nr:hypothetical protein [Agrococcus terreus]GGN87687.1 hypothetical protein GCM10010968_22500 [Agrococcus terreus]